MLFSCHGDVLQMLARLLCLEMHSEQLRQLFFFLYYISVLLQAYLWNMLECQNYPVLSAKLYA